VLQALVVEDDRSHSRYTELVLGQHGYDVRVCATGASALEAVAGEIFEVILLDIGLVDVDGIGLCRDLRAATDAAIVVLTARNDEVAKVLGFDAGADDYVIKPYSVGELIARIKAIVRRRRPSGRTPRRMETGRIALDLDLHRVAVGGEEIPVTPTEFQLLRILMSGSDRVVPRDEILETVWGPGYFGDPNVLDAHMSGLRRKLRRAGHPDPVRTVRGVGYRFCVATAA
jgi:DNA-binding response OmpR family regulator